MDGSEPASTASAAELIAKHGSVRLAGAGTQVFYRDFHLAPPIGILGRAAGQVLLFGFLSEVLLIEQQNHGRNLRQKADDSIVQRAIEIGHASGVPLVAG